MLTTPPFEAEYAAWPICPSKAATDAVLTMTPRSPSASGSLFCIAVRCQTDGVEGADDVDLKHLGEAVEIVGRVFADDLLGNRDARAIHQDAQPVTLGMPPSAQQRASNLRW